MWISTSKFEYKVAIRNTMACLLQLRGETLPGAEEEVSLLVLFTSGQRRDCEIENRLGAVAAVMWLLYLSIVVKGELNQKTKHAAYQSTSIPTLTHGHELWVMAERTRLQIQMAKMSFLPWVAGLTLREFSCTGGSQSCYASALRGTS